MVLSATPSYICTSLIIPESIHTSPPILPSNVNKTISSPQATLWECACQEELNSCKDNAVWSELMHLLTGHKAINVGFIYPLGK